MNIHEETSDAQVLCYFTTVRYPTQGLLHARQVLHHQEFRVVSQWSLGLFEIASASSVLRLQSEPLLQEFYIIFTLWKLKCIYVQWNTQLSIYNCFKSTVRTTLCNYMHYIYMHMHLCRHVFTYAYIIYASIVFIGIWFTCIYYIWINYIYIGIVFIYSVI